MPGTKRIAELLFKYLQDALSEEENRELEQWKAQSAGNQLLFDEMKNEDFIAGELSQYHNDNNRNVEKRIFDKITAEIEELKEVPVKRIRPWWRYAAAAAIILVLGAGMFLLFFDKEKKGMATNTGERHFKNDVPPGGNKAVLTLADGSEVILDTTANGTLAQQGNTKVLKLSSGQLAYNYTSGLQNGQVFYNTISTPRGGQYQVLLPDGSRVWLNAASSLRFPTAFAGKARRVEITGEAYFEVAPSSLPQSAGGGKRPFIVSVMSSPAGGPVASRGEVEVLGTHFNVMAYEDENSIKTTLLEGAVKVKKGSTVGLLKPGQQAWSDNNGAIKIVDDIDVDQAVAWKNGLFDFNNDVIMDIMRQLARWYDVEIFYPGKIPDGHYVGAIRRQANISEVLKMLEAAGGIQFSIDGKKILVKEK